MKPPLAFRLGIVAAVIVAIFATTANAQQEQNDNAFAGNRNRPAREAWLRDLGFGVFVHWSVDAQLGVVISHSLVGASDDYYDRYRNELPRSFDPYRFDAYHMAMMARIAGARYIVITAKHHSGFCLWDTKTTDFKAPNTPYGKDLLREFIDGVRKAGLAVGLYYSPEDFRFLHDHHVVIQRGDLQLSPEVEAEYNAQVREQTRELFTNYGNIDVLFIDGDHKDACKDEAWRLQPDVVITRGAVNTPEQTLPGVPTDRLWESCITMGTQWQYKPTNDVLKSGTRLIEILVETRAKGGNLLLDIGPHPDGYIPYEQETRLREIGTWNFINQEAVRGVRPWIIPNERNIWFTASPDRTTVYAVLTGLPDWPRGERKEFVLGSVQASNTTRVGVLGQNDLVTEYDHGADVKSRFNQQPDGLHISVVRAQRIYNDSKWPNPITVKLENVVPALEPPIVQTVSASAAGQRTHLTGELLKLGRGDTVKVGFEYRRYAGFVENLYSTEWNEAGFVEVRHAGPYAVDIRTPAAIGRYEFRAVVVHPRLTAYGDIKQFQVGEPPSR